MEGAVCQYLFKFQYAAVIAKKGFAFRFKYGSESFALCKALETSD